MKKIVIFEGIASSGKTTLERRLHERLEDSVLISEGETLMPLIDNKEPQKAIEHLFSVLDKIKVRSEHLFIVDRFHLTHAFRTGSSLSEFHVIEEKIKKNFVPLIVLLHMGETVISDRIKETAQLRGSLWAKGKQGSQEEKTAHYKNQQSVLEDLARQSILPVKIVDTSDKDWSRCVTEIL